jgi:hypothetical protein
MVATSAIAAPPRPAPAPPPRPRATPSIQPSNGSRLSARRPIPVAAQARPAPPLAASGNAASLGDALRGLRDAYGSAWSFEVIEHSADGGRIEVIGQLRANGATVRETAVAAVSPGASLGELLQRTANDSLCKCVDTLMRNGR